MKRAWTRIMMSLTALTLAGSASGKDTLPLRGVSVTVLPLSLQVQESPAGDEIAVRITEVLGLMLENAGMADVQVAESGWTAEGDDVAEGFSAHIQAAPPSTETALWVRFAGERRLDRIDWVLCDRTGEILTRSTTLFEEETPADPMHACLFVARALQDLSDLKDPTSRTATEGRMARTMRERSGLPAPDELEAAKERLLAMDRKWTAACAVYPVRVVGPDTADSDLAGLLAQRLAAADLGQPVAIDSALALDVPGDPNQMKVLWDTARAFREHLRQAPPDQPYALLVECGPIPDVRYVHLFLCERNGDWVTVDMQNNHHADFQEFAPDSAEDCLDLAVRRLQIRIRGSAEPR